MNYYDDEAPGRILSDTEYAEMAKLRPDVFQFERSANMRNIQTVCMILAVVSIFIITKHVPAQIAADFFDPVVKEYAARVTGPVQKPTDEEKEKVEKEVKEVVSDKKPLKPSSNRGASAQSSGGGSHKARVTNMGVLGIVDGNITGKAVATADIFAKGGFASDIDAILSGVGGLKPSGDGGVGRKGARGIGYGTGFGPSGFGGDGPGGIDNLMNSLMGSNSGSNLDLKMRKSDLKVSPTWKDGGVLTGGRSRASIQRVVMQNMAALRHAYSRRLREKPGMSGTVTVKFSIDEFGKVIFAQMMSSTVNDAELETTVVSRVRSWVFEKIDKPGDVTEVTYPFTFTQ